MAGGVVTVSDLLQLGALFAAARLGKRTAVVEGTARWHINRACDIALQPYTRAWAVKIT
jgi:hypothetical protein